VLGWVGFPFYLEDHIFIFGSVHKILLSQEREGGVLVPLLGGVLNTIYGERERYEEITTVLRR
jgi:hypothetical protein